MLYVYILLYLYSIDEKRANLWKKKKLRSQKKEQRRLYNIYTLCIVTKIYCVTREWVWYYLVVHATVHVAAARLYTLYTCGIRSRSRELLAQIAIINSLCRSKRRTHTHVCIIIFSYPREREREDIYFPGAMSRARARLFSLKAIRLYAHYCAQESTLV